MMSYEIFVAETKADLEKCFPVMKELRPHLSFNEFCEIYEQAHRMDSYQIVGIRSSDQILAVMGYRILWDYVRGKHVYIDDLVSSEKMRSKGFGAKLLEYAEQISAKEGCGVLRLCTGIENERGVSFYERHGWKRRAFAYTKKIEAANQGK